MLTRENRLTSSAVFARVVRHGRRAGTRRIVVHLDTVADQAAPRVGLVVGKGVGGAVVRNRVKRRLRHLARERVTSLPGSTVLVVRALPGAAGATSVTLGADLDRCLGKARRGLGSHRPGAMEPGANGDLRSGEATEGS